MDRWWGLGKTFTTTYKSGSETRSSCSSSCEYLWSPPFSSPSYPRLKLESPLGMPNIIMFSSWPMSIWTTNRRLTSCLTPRVTTASSPGSVVADSPC